MYFCAIFLAFMMADLNYYKPKFNWDATDKLAELNSFKSKSEVLFDGPLDESPPNRQAGLVVNWLGSYRFNLKVFEFNMWPSRQRSL